MWARWKLGQALAGMERGKAPGKGKMASTSLTAFLARIKLTKQTAMAAQRIGTLPDSTHRVDHWTHSVAKSARLVSMVEIVELQDHKTGT